MFGFLLGTACLVGLIWVLRGPHRRGCSDWGGRHFVERGEGGGFGGRAFLRWLFERLDTTPGQERVISGALTDLMDGVHAARRELRGSRVDLARAVRGESFDAEVMGEVFARQDATLAALRRTAMGSLARAHEVLDDKQRQRLADLIESSRKFHWHDPYRSHA